MLKEGSFYYILDDGSDFVLADKTKRGLTVQETAPDERLGVGAEMGIIHDMEGIGHRVAIRWHFPKERFDLGTVLVHAMAMEEKYTAMRELTCPD